MKKRTLGKNGPELTEIGFGAWAIGGPWEYGWGSVEDSESVKAIHKALDGGINWIDTAAVYGLGHSEEVVARALKGIRGTVFIATKCGMVWDEGKKVRIHASPKSIRMEIEKSLKRLNTDHIDLYQIHWPDPQTPVEDSWGTLVELKNEGKVRYIGVCNYGVEMLIKCQSIAPVQSLQPPYSLLHRDIEKEILPYCLKENIGVVAYSPMQSGLLTGKFDPAALARDDWRRKSPLYQEPYLSKALAFANSLKPTASKYEKSVAQLAVGWVLNQSAVTSAIVGARTEEQVKENIGASGLKIGDQDVKVILEMLAKTVGVS